jgi:light-regulated signal transduction histidine kinase (bacteriophytochrome)
MNQPNPPETQPSYESLSARVAELEQSLQESQTQLAATNQELDDLAHFIAHDLRAPLRGVDGYSQALLEDYESCLDEVGKAYLNFIRDSSRGASILIDRLLIYLRSIRGPLQIQPVDLSTLAQEAVLRLTDSQPERQARVEISPGLFVDGDPRMMGLMVNELIGNAWKFTAHQAAPQITFCKQDENGQRIFMVQDNGAGFKMDYANKLFRPFERLHGAHEFDGLGLGLAICHRIIQRHAGRIWVESKSGEGTTVFFTIPPGVNPLAENQFS